MDVIWVKSNLSTWCFHCPPSKIRKAFAWVRRASELLNALGRVFLPGSNPFYPSSAKFYISSKMRKYHEAFMYKLACCSSGLTTFVE